MPNMYSSCNSSGVAAHVIRRAYSCRDDTVLFRNRGKLTIAKNGRVKVIFFNFLLDFRRRYSPASHLLELLAANRHRVQDQADVHQLG